MLPWIILIRAAKLTFFGFLTAGITFVTRHVIVTRHEKEENLSDGMPKQLMQSGQNKFDPDFMQCIERPSKVFCATASSEIHLMRSSKLTSTPSYIAQPRRHPTYVALSDFLRIMAKFNIKVTLVEPSILYCMLVMQEKIYLRLRGFSIFRHLGNKNVINFIVLQNDSMNLEAIALPSLQSSGFKYWPIKGKLNDLPSVDDKRTTVHYFFEKRMIFIHVIVLFIYNQYLFHAGLPAIFQEKHNFVVNFRSSDLFGISNSVYQSFQTSLLNNNTIVPKGFLIPSNIVRFLLEIESARLAKCQRTNFNILNEINTPDVQEAAFNVALQELKSHFKISSKILIFDKTYSDWHHLCEIDSNDEYFSFAIMAEDVNNTVDDSIIKKFKDGKRLKLTHVLGQAEVSREFRFECHGAQISLFYLYKSKNHVWIGKHDLMTNQYIRHNYSPFDLCSAIIFNQIVLMPCKLERLPIKNNEKSRTRELNGYWKNGPS